MNVTLDPKDQKLLEARASECGKAPGELLCEILHEALAGKEQNGGAADGVEQESFLDAALRLGAVGCVKGGASDVAVNPRHMDGFGES